MTIQQIGAQIMPLSKTIVESEAELSIDDNLHVDESFIRVYKYSRMNAKLQQQIEANTTEEVLNNKSGLNANEFFHVTVEPAPMLNQLFKQGSLTQEEELKESEFEEEESAGMEKSDSNDRGDNLKKTYFAEPLRMMKSERNLLHYVIKPMKEMEVTSKDDQMISEYQIDSSPKQAESKNEDDLPKNDQQMDDDEIMNFWRHPVTI